MFLQTLVFQTFKIDQQMPYIYSQQYFCDRCLRIFKPMTHEEIHS
jgi:hypothetical protein